MSGRSRPGKALALAFLAAALGLIRPAMAQSFEEALGQTYQTNPELLAARQRLREIDEGVPQALSGWRPHVNFDGGPGASLLADNTDRLHYPEHRLLDDEALRLQQNLYSGGRIPAQVARAEAVVREQRANLLSTEGSVLLAAGSAYLDVLRDREIIHLNEDNIGFLQRTVRAQTEAWHAGAATEADVALAQARLAQGQGSLATARARFATAESVFEQRIGHPPATLIVPHLRYRLPAVREEAVTLAGQANFEVTGARYALDASRRGVDLARANLMPRIALEAKVERARNTDIQSFNQRDNILEGQVVLTMPLYQGGEDYSQIRQAREAELRFGNLVDQAVRQSRTRAAAGWDDWQAGQARVVAARAAIAANGVALDGYIRQQRAGARTLLDVLNEELSLLDSRVSLIVADHDTLVASLTLLDALGRLTATDLSLPVPLFDPEEHYRRVRDKWIGTTPP